ncbi:hypothetical protein CVS40_9983 [Lucilia cuprina]|nr:hypothetical protein CVS40_9983 [Lucilia cuprina]
MNINSSTIIFLLIALFAICCYGQAPPFCNSNVAFLCAGGGPSISARPGRYGLCQRYDNKCLVQQLNCIRYRNRQPCKYFDFYVKLK